LEYDGTDFKGFQRQTRARTVQGELERALERLSGERTMTQGAGRTDAGAHAAGQVVAFTTGAPYTAGTFVRALNATLPLDIRVRRARDVALAFDPRRQALSRVYRYLLLAQQAPSALWRRFAHQVSAPLDVARMDEGAEALVGCHDFRAFCGRTMNRGRGTVRRMMRAGVGRRGPLVVVELEADAFLPHQVRRIAGALVRLGLGKMDVRGFLDLVDGVPGMVAAPSLPARGLILVRVNYDEELEARVGGGETRYPRLARSPGPRGDERVSWLP